MAIIRNRKASEQGRKHLIEHLTQTGTEPELLKRLLADAPPSWMEEANAMKTLKTAQKRMPEVYDYFVMVGARRADIRSRVLLATRYRRANRTVTRDGLLQNIRDFNVKWLLLTMWSWPLPDTLYNIFQIQCEAMSNALTALTKIVEVAPRVGWQDGVPIEIINQFYEADETMRIAWRM